MKCDMSMYENFKDIQQTVDLLHQEQVNLITHLKQQESNLYSTLMEYLKCFETLLIRKDQQIQELISENTVLKSKLK